MSDNKHPVDFENQKIIPIDLEREMKKSYIDYAMSVIVGRALPDVRDGLKPVHRRILYTMYEENLTPDKAFRKSATAVGDVLGRYHPHGDASVYDALVRMAQDFSLRYVLVDGHGNFGSVDGDPPAAYRYTEARMSKMAMALMADIDKETVDFVPNYDNSRKEPWVLPARFPNLLVNGSAGIAVGMATNIPPHNMGEVIDAAVCLLDNEEADLNDLMEYVQGPDFPTSASIVGKVGIRAAYATGRGRVKVRARAEIEEMKNNRFRIVITELPYQVNKTRLVESIAELVKDKTVEGISELRDETDRGGMKVVIELKRDANAQVVLNKLYAHTALESTFAINMLALVNGEPKTLSLREMLDHYLTHQKEVIVRRTQYELRKARERAHILEGLRIAVNNLDEVIRIIRAAYNDAKAQLMARFDLSDIQGQAIIDLRLGRLQGLEVEKIENEYGELMRKITYYLEVLASEEMVRGIVRAELLETRDKFADPRRTEIIPVDDEIDLEDLIEREDCVYTLTHAGYIKRQPKTAYRAQRRGGRGVTGQTVREEDYVEELYVASTHDVLLFFTNRGRLYRTKGYFIPEAGRAAKGTNLVNLLPLDAGEKVTAIIPVAADDANRYLMMITKGGTVKRIELGRLDTARKAGIRALRLDEGDELIAVRKTGGDEQLILATREGMAICFEETDVREMGRDATGVRGIRLEEGDYVVGAVRLHDDETLLTVTENGYGKRTEISEYRRGGEAQHRGGKGLKAHGITAKTGKVAAIKAVAETDDVLLISDDGTIIRMPAADINLYSRSAQGVILMRLSDGAQVISVASTGHEDDEEDGDGAGDNVSAGADVSGAGPDAVGVADGSVPDSVPVPGSGAIKKEELKIK
ncbi:MAG: DNA gyrase subunit A, partial [Oscillospiraceae bacterium]|nr:DNA gyrase subunit A [Oscillospiraceae bacterium]